MSWSKLLSSVPPSTRDNIVEMEPRDKDEMPAAGPLLWRSIMIQKREIKEVEMQRAKVEAELAELVAMYNKNIGHMDNQITERRRKMMQDYERWVMLRRTLEMGIDDEPEGEHEQDRR